jgi:hypothetical protein
MPLQPEAAGVKVIVAFRRSLAWESVGDSEDAHQVGHGLNTFFRYCSAATEVDEYHVARVACCEIPLESFIARLGSGVSKASLSQQAPTHCRNH